MTARYEVGQRVWIHSMNSRGREPVSANVVKVGRTLVTVDCDWYGGTRPSTFRIETGRQNDQFEHQWIVTEEEQVENDRRSIPLAYLREKRVHELDHLGLSADALEQIVAVIGADLGETP